MTTPANMQQQARPAPPRRAAWVQRCLDAGNVWLASAMAILWLELMVREPMWSVGRWVVGIAVKLSPTEVEWLMARKIGRSEWHEPARMAGIGRPQLWPWSGTAGSELDRWSGFLANIFASALYLGGILALLIAAMMLVARWFVRGMAGEGWIASRSPRTVGEHARAGSPYRVSRWPWVLAGVAACVGSIRIGYGVNSEARPPGSQETPYYAHEAGIVLMSGVVLVWIVACWCAWRERVERTRMDATGDATCDRCGYSRRGLALHARCPECGTECSTPSPSAARRWRVLRNMPRRMAVCLLVACFVACAGMTLPLWKDYTESIMPTWGERLINDTQRLTGMTRVTVWFGKLPH
ncbi:MAG: hypothetical protein MUE97_07485 [Phycisphaerales bacterium]|jgi:hypothetical protein|nr:hypothetical protein [Phycisphaerales bacterium]